MRLSFSTRGWNALSWEDCVRVASEMHFQGIEIYDINRQARFNGPAGPFGRGKTETLRTLRDLRLEIPCLDSYIRLDAPDARDEMTKMIETAGWLGVPYVSCALTEDRQEEASSLLREILPLAKEKHVEILIKTAGLFADTLILRNFLNDFSDDALGVLWVWHHPFFDHGESPDETIRNLGAYVRHVHVRDSSKDGSLTFIGEGELPISEMIAALSSIDYDGYVSLEWKPEWTEDITDYEFIFPHYVNYMNRHLPRKHRENDLRLNHDGTGYYVWEKDALINLTFPQVLDRMVQEFPDQIAFKYTTLDYTRSYAAFRDDVDSFARALVSLGVRAGSKVAIWATNVPEWFITFWAATKIGAVLVTVNTAYKIHEAEYLLSQSDTHTLVMIERCLDSDYSDIIGRLCPELEHAVPGEPLHVKK
ncbi:MAG: AMP-binding protein, partial [Clostridia bacterium]|nr:AMP-binding protein [Clostridia bacterium]